MKICRYCLSAKIRLRVTPEKLPEEGFSLVEGLIAIVILSIASAITAATFFSSSSQFRSSSRINELQDLVESDLAVVRDANERLVCVDSACALSSTATNKNSYFPSGAANITFFNNLCTNRNPDQGFANQLNTLLPSPNSRITRTMVRETQGHRYTLVYREASTNTFLRQASLTPTTVAWCPITACDSSGNCQP